MQHTSKYIASGFFVSNLVFIFFGSLIYPWFISIDEMNHRIALVLMFTIVMTTLCSSIASYFWSFTGIPLKKLRLLAVVNTIWVLFPFLLHPHFGVTHDSVIGSLLYNYFWKAILLVLVFCSLLGNWFGRRVFYE